MEANKGKKSIVISEFSAENLMACWTLVGRRILLSWQPCSRTTLLVK